MAAWQTRLKYTLQKSFMYSYVLVRTHLEQHPGQLPPIPKLVRALNRVLEHESSYVTALLPSALGGESMRPTIRGTKDEWVLYRYLLPPLWHTISVGDVVAMRCNLANVSTANPEEEEAPPEAKAAPNQLPFVFRRVAAVAGDEMVSSQPSDEPLRIEKDHFWLLADNPAVPAKEALDSRTIGPVHIKDIAGRALYVMRSAVDHEPIQNSDQATIDDAPTMAMECHIEQLLERIKEEQLG
ncbi:hypothetical protein CLOM_g14070 [Closterium sp. NIES-68]|nr:hypothetical protein CLOM_g22187 [Closterium sp. NIES-68]GJP55088.1 hypothetical protein CLOM_g14070 [Closterium sp. NIES-68]GJP82077.1 hypothetical protein CLOP_g12300 [Closterium sp. NIES-67]GJP86229.1 hypothetical protein CLOP_g16278 [Closterium sp. NIES-67]